jgi:hypothetical protein
MQARAIFVGEQPGDQEDLQGRPFVGPAGVLLRSALREAGFSDAEGYLTNAVKHFKFVPRGKRRIHKTPSAREIDHCRWWLDRELALLESPLVVTLGASALRAVAGPRRGLLTCGDAQSQLARVPCCRLSIPPICFDCRIQPQKRRRSAPSPATSSKRLFSLTRVCGRTAANRLYGAAMTALTKSGASIVRLTAYSDRRTLSCYVVLELQKNELKSLRTGSRTQNRSHLVGALQSSRRAPIAPRRRSR